MLAETLFLEQKSHLVLPKGVHHQHFVNNMLSSLIIVVLF